MLKQRIATAVVLFALLLPALFASAAWPFAVLSLVGISLAGWEWGRLNTGRWNMKGGRGDVGGGEIDGGGRNGSAQIGPAVAVSTGLAVAAVCAAALLAGITGAVSGHGTGTDAAAVTAAGRIPSAWSGVWWIALLVWVLGGGAALRGGPPAWPRVPVAIRIGLGILLLWTAWLAMNVARAAGVNFVLSVFCLVWVADVSAYFGGRALGGRKLAPSISPGKSWAGVWSGMAGALVLAAFWLWLDRTFAVGAPSLYTRLLGRWNGPGLVLVVVFLAALSVVGDLCESLVKRAAGAKDSSALLPGHGGVLDRIDALLPVLPVAMALVSL